VAQDTVNTDGPGQSVKNVPCAISVRAHG